MWSSCTRFTLGPLALRGSCTHANSLHSEFLLTGMWLQQFLKSCPVCGCRMLQTLVTPRSSARAVRCCCCQKQPWHMCCLQQLSVLATPCPEPARNTKPAIDSGLVVMLAPGCIHLQQATRLPGPMNAHCLQLALVLVARTQVHTPCGLCDRVTGCQTAAADIGQALGTTPVLCIC